MSAKKSDDGNAIVWTVLAVIAFLAVAWPYFLGTWLAVQFGAENPSTTRNVVGWVFEALWLTALVSAVGWLWLADRREKEKARRLEATKQRRLEEFGSAGAQLYENAETSVSEIAASEAARSGWLGDSSDFDFHEDLDAIADNLRRAEGIREVIAEASSIKNFTQSDNKMLGDARSAIAKLEQSVEQRVDLIGECAQQAADIDRQLLEDRESVEMAKRRDDLRDRLSPILYGSTASPTEGVSESADIVNARAAAFHDLKSLINKHRIDTMGE